MNSAIQIKRTSSTLLISIPLLLAPLTAFAVPDGNTSFGVRALPGNTTGGFNTGLGYDALSINSSGHDNTAVGGWALIANTTGSDNVAVGSFALRTGGNKNTAVGSTALVNVGGTSNNNIAIGWSAGIGLQGPVHHNIDIGNQGVAGDSNTIRIGDSNHTRTFIAGIHGVAIAGTGVVVNAAGQLGVAASSARFKDEIQPMDRTSEAILALKPVTFRYKKELDPQGIPQFGLVAEDVEKVNPDLVVRDAEGKVNTVRYEAINAMLLNEFLKEHRKNEQQEKTIALQQKQIEALTAGLQKVTAQLELKERAPQAVLNNQ
jgi:hypothetical protein